MDLNEFAKKVHENSVAHGWWEDDRDYLEVAALIHSELSEALEEYRVGRQMVWYDCDCDACTLCEDKPAENCTCVGDETGCCQGDKKPEGIAVELIDAVIRMLDYLGKEGIQIDTSDEERPKGINKAYYDDRLPIFVANLHYLVANTYRSPFGFTYRDSNCARETFRLAIILIFKWIRNRNLDPEAILLEKHEYNKGRPYKHGGKVC